MKKAGNIIFGVLIAGGITVSAYAGYRIWSQYQEYKKGIDEYKELEAPVVEEVVETAEEPAEEDITYPILDIDFDKYEGINEDFLGIIYIPSLELQYPVVQGDNNEYYVTHTFENEENSSGCIFMDCYAPSDFSELNTFIFGHNMANGTMFGSLKYLVRGEKSCADDPYVYIYTRKEVRKYHIFAYYLCPWEDELFEFYNEPDEYDSFVENALGKSVYEQTAEEMDDFTQKPTLITLASCYGYNHEAHTILNAALVGTHQNET